MRISEEELEESKVLIKFRDSLRNENKGYIVKLGYYRFGFYIDTNAPKGELNIPANKELTVNDNVISYKGKAICYINYGQLFVNTKEAKRHIR